MRVIRWAQHVELVEKRSSAYRVLVGNPERDHLEDSGTNGRIILRSTFRRWGGGEDGLDWSGSRLGQWQALGKCSSEPLGCKKTAGKLTS